MKPIPALSIMLLGWAICFAVQSQVKPTPDTAQKWAGRDQIRFRSIDLSPAERQFLVEHPKIRVAIANENYAPLQYLDSDGKIGGISIETLRALSATLGIELEPVIIDRWSDVLKALKERRADVIPYAGYSKERDEYLDFTLGITRIPGGLLGLADEDTLTENPSLTDVSVGVGRGFVSEKWLSVFYPKASPVPFNTMKDIIQAIKEHRVSYFFGPVLETTAAAARDGMLDLELKKPHYYGSGWAHIAIRSDWPILTRLMNRIIGGERDLLSNGAGNQQGGRSQPSLNKRLPLNDEQTQLISNIGVLRVGAVRGLYALNDIDSDGHHLGIGAEYTSILAHRLGVPVRIDRFNSESEMIEAALNREVDLIPFFAKTPERETDFSFSVPYVEMPYVLLGPANGALYWNLNSLSGRRLALAKNHPFIQTIRKQYPRIQILQTANSHQAIDAVASGQADAALELKLFANQFVNGIHAGEIRSLTQVDDLPGSISMAVPRAMSQLTPLIDSALATVTAAERESALRRWIAVDLEPVQDLRTYVNWLLFALGVLALVAVAIVRWNRRIELESDARLKAEHRLIEMTDHLETAVYEYWQYPDGKVSQQFANVQTRKIVRGDDIAPSDGAQTPPLFEFVHQDDYQRVATALAHSLKTGTEFNETFRFHFPSGRLGWLMAQTTPRMRSDGVRVWSGYLFDLTQERELLNELHESLSAKEEFIATAGHELRAPVHNAILAMRAINLDDTDETKRAPVQLARQSIEDLGGMVADLLDLRRIDARGLTITDQKTDLADLCELAGRAFLFLSKENDVRLSFRLSPERPPAVWTDSNRLRQILFNLLSNALKFTRRGEVDAAISLTSLDPVNFTAKLELEVRDTGIGIPSSQLSSIFEPFEILDEHDRRNTGLGLAITQRLVQALRGQITVQSTVSKGTTFNVKIPVRVDPISLDNPDDDQHRVMIASKSSSPTNVGSANLLLVDDDRFMRANLTELLTAQGFRVIEAESAAEALAILQVLPFDIVCSDFRMPGTGGIALAAKIRKLSLETIPVLIGMTAGASDKETKEALKVFDAVLLKPISGIQVVAAVESFNQTVTD